MPRRYSLVLVLLVVVLGPWSVGRAIGDDRTPAAASAAAGTLDTATPAPRPAAVEKDIAVFFSPHGGCTRAITDEIANAKQRVWVQAYSFTSAPIAKALLEAHKRGLEVKVVLDQSQKTAQYSSATFLFNSGIPTFIDHRHAIAHNKVMIIDDATLITGSFNFSKAAEESNAENLLVIHNHAELIKAYRANFQDHLEHSVAYTGPVPAAAPSRAPPATQPSAEAEAASAQPDAADPIVHVTRSGKKYHLEGCRSLSRSDTPLRLSEVKQQGYTPCSVCRPPE